MKDLRPILSAAVVASAMLGIGAASAADLPVKAPPPPPAPIYSWTGWYVGGNVGYSWGNANTDIAGSASLVTFPGLLTANPGFPGFPSSYAFADSNKARLSGIIGGAQVGYNYQFNAQWVWGFETDFQGSDERRGATFVDAFSSPIVTGFSQSGLPPLPAGTFPGLLQGTAVTAYQARIDWFGTVRGRVGYLVNDQVLLYGTGGLAYGQVRVSGNTIISETSSGLNSGPPFAIPPGGTQFSGSKTSVGFAVGAGIEGRSYWLPAGWTWKAEYLYVDLGSLDSATPFAIPGAAFLATPANTISAQNGTITTRTHFADNIVRVGLNYQFH